MKTITFLFVVLIIALHATEMLAAASTKPVPKDKKPAPRMEVAFVLDTTGSMSGMIAGAKQKIWAIANKLKSADPVPEIRFGLVAYRDRGNAYVTQVYPLSDNLDSVYQTLSGFEANGGGDDPESVNEALHRAVHELQWSDDPQVLRVIFLVGDCPPHMDYADDVKYPVSCREAKQRGILVNTLQCGKVPQTEPVWREIASSTGGTFAQILQDGGSITIETPFDAEVVRLTHALDATIVPYGTDEERASVARNRLVLTGMSSEGVADRSSFLAKMEYGAVVAGKGDLVLEVMSDRIQLSAINPEELDPALRGMFAAERNNYVLKKVEERRVLIEQLTAVLKKRDAAVAEQLKALEGKDDVLELSAFQVLETQAGDKGYRFKKGD